MSINDRTKAKRHLYMPGDTVSGVIKKYNLFDISKQEMDAMIEEYKQINAPGVIKPGMSALIPILVRHHDAVFNR
jgi:hypothetical protein